MGLTSKARWVGAPAHWATGRDARGRPTPAYVVIHVTDGSEGPTAAEDGAANDKRRPDSVSTHLFVDSDTSVREVHDQDTAFAAYPKGNALGIQVEICGRAAQTVAQWHDEATTETLRLAAYEVAVLCQDHGLPVRHLTVAECRAAWYAPAANTRGIVGHWDVTRAYPEDGGTHTDPGPAFPWVEFLAMVRGYLAPDTAPTTTKGSALMRYVFDTSYTDRPAGLVDPKGQPVVVATDGLGAYVVRDVSFRLNAVELAASGAPVITLTKGGNMPAEWDFDQAFGEVTGGCIFMGDAGLAAWREPAGVGGGAHVHAVSVSGNSGPAVAA